MGILLHSSSPLEHPLV